MKQLAYILLFLLGNIGFQHSLCGQEEESAAVSLEGHTDEFQESFFEALKQKGIENYDKAINHLLECRRLDPANPVVAHELAKAYGENGQLQPALDYGLEAVNAEPGNLWYLETIVALNRQQGSEIEAIKDRMPFANTLLKENLARIYYRRNEYKAAMEVIQELEKSGLTEQLTAIISDSLRQNAEEAEKPEEAENPLEAYRRELGQLLENEAYEALEERSSDALESYPSFPYFYYVRGMVLNHNGKYQAAATVLEEGLDYLLDDPGLEVDMYKALAVAYTGMGDSTKANMYLSKIKSGS